MNIARPIAPAILAACLLAVAAATASADAFIKVDPFAATWSRFPADARGEGMGLATAVDPRGATAAWWNPAPLPDGRGLTASYTVWEYPVDDVAWRPAALRLDLDAVTVSAAWGRFHVGPLPIRTAYDPDADPATLEFTDHLLQLGAAADLGPRLTGSDAWSWTLGVNLRWLREEGVYGTASAWDGDLGSSLAWTLVDEGGHRLRWHATAMVRNVARGGLDYGDVTATLPRHYHAGLGLQLALGEPRDGAWPLELVVSHAWRRDVEDLMTSGDSEHLGLEATVMGLVSARAGRRDGGAPLLADDWSWGLGVSPRLGAWRLALDYARTDVDSELWQESLDHWTVSVRRDLR